METGELQATQADSEATGLNLYRPEWRVVAFLLLAPVCYELWWYWQLFQFTQREGFPRARMFWWIFVPIYGWVVIYRQFDDLEQASVRIGGPAFSSGTAIALVICSWIAGNASGRIGGWTSFGVFVASDVFIAIAGSMVQPAANAYLRQRYPDARPLGITWGEGIAVGLGILLLALLIPGSLLA